MGASVENTRLIVLVDDSRTFSMYIGLLLKRMGFDVLPAESAEVGLKMVRVFRPDLVLIDRYLPGGDGSDLVAEIRQDGDLSGIPVVLVSASDESELAETADRSAADGWLTKPITPYALHRVLSKTLSATDGRVRRRLRCSWSRKVKIEFEDQALLLPAVSLSEGGVYLRHRDPLPVGAEVRLILPLGDGDLPLHGRVIYQKDVFRDSLRIEPGMAILFEDVDEEILLRLRREVSEELAGDLIEEQGPEDILTLD